MSQAAYSDLKAAWDLAAVTDLRAGDQIVPRQVQLIISDLCNHDCHFCSYRMSDGLSSQNFGENTGKGFTMNPNRKIPTEKAFEILKDCASLGVRAIQFTGGGEPTVHPDHLELFRAAQSLGMKTGLVTNGYKLSDGWRDVYPSMEWIRVSVDAGSAETYGRVRRIKPEGFARTLSNIREITGECSSRVGGPLIGVGYVVTMENYHEIVDGCRVLSHTGASYVRLSGMFSKQGEDYYGGHGHYNQILSLIERARRECETDTFKIVDLFGERLEDLHQHSPDYDFCGYQQFNMYIGGDLKVYRCCTTAYTDHGEVGDLSDKTLRQWFFSQQKHENYRNFCARSCDVCQFNGKNRVINYMIDPSPTHVEFV